MSLIISLKLTIQGCSRCTPHNKFINRVAMFFYQNQLCTVSGGSPCAWLLLKCATIGSENKQQQQQLTEASKLSVVPPTCFQIWRSYRQISLPPGVPSELLGLSCRRDSLMVQHLTGFREVVGSIPALGTSHPDFS